MSKETTMQEQQDRREEASAAAEAPGRPGSPAPWGLGYGEPRPKREVPLQLMRGESLEALSRELGVEMYRLEAGLERARASIDASRRERARSWRG